MAITKKLTELDILHAEHAVLKAAQEWLGMEASDVNYVMGVYDMADELMKKLEDDNGEDE